MKQVIFSILMLLVCSLSAQTIELTDEYQQVEQLNDSTYVVQTYAIYAIEFTEAVMRIDTVLQPEKAVVLDSAGVVGYLYTTAFNEQNQQSAIAARAFNILRYNRNVIDATTLITSITNSESNYFEESAKRNATVLSGTYRIRYDSAGVAQNDLFQMELISTPAHPDGRLMRLTNQRNGQFYTVQVWHRWKWRIVNWQYGEDMFVWDRVSTAQAPFYRPQFDYASREDNITLIRKLD